MWDVRAQHETVWNLSWPGCEEKVCHDLPRAQTHWARPRCSGKRGRMTWAWAWLLKIWSFWHGKGPCSPWDRFCSIWLQVSDAPIPLKRKCGINLCENGSWGIIAARQTKIHHGTIRCWEELAGHGLSFLLYSLFPCSPLLTFYSLTHTDSE